MLNLPHQTWLWLRGTVRVMGYNFYKVGGIDPYLTSKAEKERKQYYEDTYWEG